MPWGVSLFPLAHYQPGASEALRYWCSRSPCHSMTPSVKVEKIHPKMDGTLLKSAVGPTCPATVSSSVKPGLNCPSIPKPTLPSPGQILNGKGLPALPTLEKKSEDNSNNRKFLNKRLSGNLTFSHNVSLCINWLFLGKQVSCYL